MPLSLARIMGNINGFVHSHRFPGRQYRGSHSE